MIAWLAWPNSWRCCSVTGGGNCCCSFSSFCCRYFWLLAVLLLLPSFTFSPWPGASLHLDCDWLDSFVFSFFIVWARKVGAKFYWDHAYVTKFKSTIITSCFSDIIQKNYYLLLFCCSRLLTLLPVWIDIFGIITDQRHNIYDNSCSQT